MIKKELIIGLMNNKNILKQFVSIMTNEEIQRRIKDYWTIYEHLDHLVAAQKVLLGRIKQFMSEDNPAMKPYTPDDRPAVENANKSAGDLVNEFCKLRDIQIGLVKRAKQGVWGKEGRHEEYTKYSFEILLRHILLHDSFHMSRMEELWIKREEYIMELNQR
jgi:uncharacterized damage-inducible protein DinB